MLFKKKKQIHFNPKASCYLVAKQVCVYEEQIIVTVLMFCCQLLLVAFNFELLVKAR